MLLVTTTARRSDAFGTTCEGFREFCHFLPTDHRLAAVVHDEHDRSGKPCRRTVHGRLWYSHKPSPGIRPRWEGFGQRYGMRFTGIATGNAIEASVDALWGEDPRYFRAADQSLKGRIKNVVVMTFAARQAEGNLAPAYARYIGIAGNNFLSNTWRADSESGTGDAGLRTALGFAGRMGRDGFAEFWPTITKHVFHRNR